MADCERWGQGQSRSTRGEGQSRVRRLSVLTFHCPVYFLWASWSSGAWWGLSKGLDRADRPLSSETTHGYP